MLPSPSLRSGARSSGRPGPGAGARPGPGARPGAILVSGSIAVPASGRSAARPGPRLLPLVLDQPDLATVQLSVVQLVQSPLHVGLGAELHEALAASDVVSVGVHHLTGLPHVVLQVLPGGPAGQVLHKQAISSPPPWRVSSPPGR